MKKYLPIRIVYILLFVFTILFTSITAAAVMRMGRKNEERFIGQRFAYLDSVLMSNSQHEEYDLAGEHANTMLGIVGLHNMDGIYVELTDLDGQLLNSFGDKQDNILYQYESSPNYGILRVEAYSYIFGYGDALRSIALAVGLTVLVMMVVVSVIVKKLKRMSS